ncbi:hypothetical protein J4405_02985 [Candidatus Woesearchaeota archaeon]|nr:hypothetical protein [Candidatus Woesearchaeota archaeon]
MRTFAKIAAIFSIIASLTAARVASRQQEQARPSVSEVFSQLKRGELKITEYKANCRQGLNQIGYTVHSLTFTPSDTSVTQITVQADYHPPVSICTDTLTFYVNGAWYPLNQSPRNFPDSVKTRFDSELQAARNHQ